MRTEILDRAVSEFLGKHADAVVVNLGGGLCTRFSRLDNGRVRWLEVDLPEVEPVWLQVFQTTDRHQFLAYSVLDYAWVEAIKPFKASPILFIAEGLLMYFSESEVKQLLKTIQTNFPQSQMLFEALSPFMIANYKRHPAVSQTNAVFKWGIKTGKELEAWDSNIQLIEEWYYIDRHPNRWRWMQLFKFIPPLRRSMKIIQLRFI
ncbi:MAG: class I SAM-dependent methyltransferase [Pleurocapsa sp. CRU_1_2]|nr:class I SAM-dependent methyltransferase [Pleurocapsa sp. CRU_1_2]